ncbi:MAG: glycosyltransferase family 9 protein [Candidatus Omnitrophota bacterium]
MSKGIPILKIDCRNFQGDKPCRFYPADCYYPHCNRYAACKTKILIIKLAAIGDVLRTTPVLPVLKRKYPGSHITWVAHKSAAEILYGNKFIDQLLELDLGTILRLQVERFSVLINLDKDTAALGLAGIVQADEKIGFGLDQSGKICAFNPQAEYAFRLSFSNKLKFKENKKTYQQIIFEAIGLEQAYGEYILKLSRPDLNFGRTLFKKLGIGEKRVKIGLNTGAGKVFPTKRWPRENFIKLACRINKEMKAQIILLGGPEEEKLNLDIQKSLMPFVFDTGCHNTLGEFMGILTRCDIIVTADTLAMHLAIGLKKKVVALFGPTSAQEVDLYDRGIKIIATPQCAPCYKSKCATLKCMKNIKPQTVFAAIKRLLPKSSLKSN